MTNDRPLNILRLVNYNVYWLIIGHPYCRTSYIICYIICFILRAKLVNDEAALLMKINKNKNIAKMNAKEGMIQKFLEQVHLLRDLKG